MLAIIGTEMPKDCISCYFEAMNICFLTSTHVESLGKPEWCPLVEVTEPKHGHWIDIGSGQECSVCGEIQYGYDNGRHYCPNCGNPMDGMTEKEKSNAEERYNPCLTCSQIGNTFCDCSKR